MFQNIDHSERHFSRMEKTLYMAFIIHIALSQEQCPSFDGCVCIVSEGMNEEMHDCTSAALSEVPHFPDKTMDVILVNNMIENLPVGIFAANIGLKLLDLSGNMISYLPKDIFAVNVNLENLLLANNMIETLPVEIFAGNIELQWLDLSENMISYLPKEIFATNVNLASLKLHENPIETFYNGTFDTSILTLFTISFNCNCMEKNIYQLILEELKELIFDVKCKGSDEDLRSQQAILCTDTERLTLYNTSHDAKGCACPESTSGISFEDEGSTNVPTENNLSVNDVKQKSRDKMSIVTPYFVFGSAIGILCGTITVATVIVNMVSKSNLKGLEMKAKEKQNKCDNEQQRIKIDIDMTDSAFYEYKEATRFSNIPPDCHMTTF